jgi:hypothetical protein
MKLENFDTFDEGEAAEYLRSFLGAECRALDSMRPAAERAGVAIDYAVASLPTVIKWILSGVQIIRVPLPDSEPEWIRQMDGQGLVELSENSKSLILRAAYYMGETFVRSHPGLHWSTGNPEYIEKHMPVVAGFESGCEMAPIMIVENLAKRIHGNNAPPGDIDRAVLEWEKDIPP